MLQEIQVKGGLKNNPIRRGGGVGFFWNSPMLPRLDCSYGKTFIPVAKMLVSTTKILTTGLP